MKKLNPVYARIVAEKVNQCPYFSLISMNVKSIEMGKSLLEVDIMEKHLQPFGNVHGGVFSSLVDAAVFWAVFTEIDDGLGMTTVELKLNYLAPASTGKMIAKGRRIKTGKTICLGEAYIEDEEGKLLAHGTSTMMILKDLPIQSKERLPQKFVSTTSG
ncbi:MAG: PaaI family thioesterase [Deltaproteobacteria bacterium]|nr:PaaI family thioesterase [Deltaproteobacteria bacterium]